MRYTTVCQPSVRSANSPYTSAHGYATSMRCPCGSVSNSDSNAGRQATRLK